MILQKCSSCPFVDQKRFPLQPFVDSPNNDLAKVFFVVLRGPSWIKRFSLRPFVDSPNNDLAKVFFVVLRGPSWIKKGFLRGLSWIDHILILQISVQTNVNEP